MAADAIDLKYARQAARHIGADHTEVLMTPEQVVAVLPDVVRTLATYDITTIRASVGMYLVCKAIHEQTGIKTLLTGEISDELFGYKYTDYAPSAAAFQQEAEKRLRELYAYDVLRADRCLAAHSLEARVPFGDLDFVRYVMAINPSRKLNTTGKGKYLLRQAFAGTGLLPDSILWREKAAFSDAVGHSMVDDLKAYAEQRYTGAEFAQKCAQYSDPRPVYQGEPALPRAVRAVLPRPGADDPRLLDAQPRLARLPRQRPPAPACSPTTAPAGSESSADRTGRTKTKTPKKHAPAFSSARAFCAARKAGGQCKNFSS